MNIVKRAGRALDAPNFSSRPRRPKRSEPSCELLEHRRLLSADTTAASLSQLVAHTNLDVMTAVSTGPTGLTPAQIKKAYGINLISFSGGTITGDGAGETIAIVDAYNVPNIAADLAAFDKEFGLAAPPSFTVDNLGATTTDAGWALETSLDVEWAHAIAPAANIILVEAASSSLSSLFSAVSFAGKQSGVDVVSMSWGADEFQGESSYDSLFTTAAGHVNVTYVAASGDSGAFSGPEYPSVSPNVLAVGGTTLSLTASGSYASESGWSGSTGGFSGTDSNFMFYESEPPYQTSTLESVGLSDGVRTTPDVAFNADPNSGVSVYDSVGYEGVSGWFDVGGTSAAAPAWAGLIAIADQGLATGGHGSLTTTQALTDLYALPSSAFNDITTGSNGFNATAGYDLVTGLGTPRSNLLVAGLLALNGVSENSPTTTTTAAAAPTASTTTTTVASPHKVKAKHVKVVVKKKHKVAHKADVLGPSTAGLSLSSESTTRSSRSDSGSNTTNASTASLDMAATSQSAGQELAALSSQTSSILISATDVQQLDSTDQTSVVLAPVNQGLEPGQDLATDPEIAVEPEPHVSSQTVLASQPSSSFKEQNPMTRPAFVTYEPMLAQAPAFPVQALLSLANDEFDDALEQVAASVLTSRVKPARTHVAAPEEKPAVSAPSAASTLIAAGAIAGAGYRLVLQPPDDPKARPSWYSRFPLA
jgi:hypothetical protein